ncbi:MAG: hypothetical protein H6622_13880 [Halobacteriovoraceae bacterium]|nr:hypothetical protein [Halobacteriovoraceae bacterium]
MKIFYKWLNISLALIFFSTTAILWFRHYSMNLNYGLVTVDKKYCFEEKNSSLYHLTWNKFSGICYIDQVQVFSHFLYLEYFKILNGRLVYIDLPIIDFHKKKAEEIFRPKLKISKE